MIEIIFVLCIFFLFTGVVSVGHLMRKGNKEGITSSSDNVLIVVYIVLFFLVLFAFFALCSGDAHNPLRNLLVWVGILLVVILLTKKIYKRNWITSIVSVLSLSLLTIFLVLTLINFSMFHCHQGNTVIIGWTRLSPLSSSIVYSSTSQIFSAQFNNLNGMPIKVKAVLTNESVTNQPCAVTINEAVADPTSGVLNKEVTVGAGDTFQLNATCLTAVKKVQEPYIMRIIIVYHTVLNRTEHIEIGEIRGSAE